MQPDWRGNKPSSRSNVRRPGWQPDPQVSDPGAARRRKTWLAGIGFFTCVIAVAILIYILWPPPPSRVLLFVASYSHQLAVPPNSYGMAGAVALSERCLEMRQKAEEGFWWIKPTPDVGRPQAGGGQKFKPEPLVSTDEELRQLSNALAAAPEETLVLLFSGHGGSDGRAEGKSAYILTDSGRPLIVRDLLKILVGKELQSKKLLVLFDCTTFDLDWNTGLLTNSFALELRELFQQSEFRDAKNLVVICSSDVGQKSWVSEEWRRTVFMHWVIEGLSGCAVHPSRNALNAAELFEYVKTRTQSWVAGNRDAVQIPFMLPNEEEGLKRAKEMHLASLEPREETPIKDAPGYGFAEAAAIRKAWERYHQLKTSVPTTAISPHRWRLFRELTMRLEHCLRAGDTESAQHWTQQIELVEEEIRAASRLLAKMTSAPNALPLGRVSGTEANPAANWSERELDELILAPADRQRSRWEKLLEDPPLKDNAELQQIFRTRLTERLFDRLERDPDLKVLDWMKSTLALLNLVGEGRSRPAELHFLRMLDHVLLRSSPAGERLPPDRVLRTAFRVRRLAEQAAFSAGKRTTDHTYSEWLPRALRGQVEQADHRRRIGEDLLFADPSTGYRLAEEYLNAAEASYRQVLADFERLQQAFRLRDQATAELPYYTRWKLQSSIREVGEAKELGVRELEQLWERVHELSNRLSEVDPLLPSSAKLDYWQSPDSRKLVEAITLAMNRLREEFETINRTLGIERRVGNVALHDRQLSVPLLDEPEQRVRTLTTLRAITQELAAEWKSDSKYGSSYDSETARMNLLNQARTHGRLAMAMLGSRTMTTLFDRYPRELDKPNDVASGFKREERAAVERASHQIGSYFRKWEEAVGATASADSEWCERFALLSNDWPRSDLVKVPEPTRELRSKRWQQLFLWQAKRTCLDHWYDENRSPYWNRNAQLYLTDARDLTGDSTDEALERLWKAELAEVKQLLKTPPLKMVPVVPAFDLTSKALFTLDFRLEGATAPLVEGQAVWKATVAPDKAPVQLAPDAPARRYQTVTLREGSSDVLVVHLKADSKGVGETQLAVSASFFFRGQEGSGVCKVRLENVPDLVLRRYAPSATDLPGIAARGDEQLSLGKLAIVLDASNSMGLKSDENSRLQLALKKLREVLLQLPRETKVSIWLFGHGLLLTKEQYRSFQGNLTDKTLSEEVIKETVIDWDPKNPEPLDRLLTQILAKISEGVSGQELASFNIDKHFNKARWNTPVYRTMKETRDALLKDPNYQGPKTILMLTDGQDNSSDANRIAELIPKDFEGKGITIHYVLFQSDQTDSDLEEAAFARKQFGVIEKLDPPGRIWQANNAEELAKDLREALRPRLRLLREGRDIPELVRPNLSPGLALSPSLKLLQNLSWSPMLPAREYDSTILGSRRNLRLNLGDRLIVRLSTPLNSHTVRYRRELLSEQRELANAPKTSAEAPWQMTALLNAANSMGGLEVLAAIEDTTASRELQNSAIPLEVLRPNFVWWEIDSPETDQRPRQWEALNLYAYPAPVWRLRVGDWPRFAGSPAKPRIQAWVSSSAPSRYATNQYRFADSTRATYQPPGGGQRLDIELWTERRTVRVLRNGLEEQVAVDCLVVQMPHPPDQRVLVRLDGLTPEGEEHRYFASTHRYEGVFWPIPPNVPREGINLEFIAVEAFKRNAEKLELRLEQPKEGGVTPLPPIGLRRSN